MKNNLELEPYKTFNVKTFFIGIFMGMADIVPGVSGGTVAFIMGVYPRFIHALSQLKINLISLVFKGQFKKALEQIDFFFLVSLGTGILSAIILSSRLIHYLLNSFPIQTWSFFIGLIVASTLYLILQNKKSFKVNHWCFMALGFIGSYWLTGLSAFNTGESFLNYFLVGGLAITAMVLPGISGSFMLVMMGKYKAIIGMLKAPFADDNLLYLAVFSLGCLAGLIGFSKLLKYLLSRFYFSILSGLIGVMLGAVRKLWPFKHEEVEVLPSGKKIILSSENYLSYELNENLMMVGFVILGFVLVALTQKSIKKSHTSPVSS